MSKTILVPVDASEYSDKALAFACDYANKFDAQVIILHVCHPPYDGQMLAVGASAAIFHATPEEIKAAGQAVVEAAVTLAAGHGYTNAETIIEAGDPARVIVNTAKSRKVDMIILGSRGHGDLAGLLLGSVSHKVNHLAPCTCITVK